MEGNDAQPPNNDFSWADARSALLALGYGHEDIPPQFDALIFSLLRDLLATKGAKEEACTHVDRWTRELQRAMDQVWNCIMYPPFKTSFTRKLKNLDNSCERRLHPY